MLTDSSFEALGPQAELAFVLLDLVDQPELFCLDEGYWRVGGQGRYRLLRLRLFGVLLLRRRDYHRHRAFDVAHRWFWLGVVAFLRLVLTILINLLFSIHLLAREPDDLST